MPLVLLIAVCWTQTNIQCPENGLAWNNVTDDGRQLGRRRLPLAYSADKPVHRQMTLQGTLPAWIEPRGRLMVPKKASSSARESRWLSNEFLTPWYYSSYGTPIPGEQGRIR